jgi:hypothetical protein
MPAAGIPVSTNMVESAVIKAVRIPYIPDPTSLHHAHSALYSFPYSP